MFPVFDFAVSVTNMALSDDQSLHLHLKQLCHHVKTMLVPQFKTSTLLYIVSFNIFCLAYI